MRISLKGMQYTPWQQQIALVEAEADEWDEFLESAEEQSGIVGAPSQSQRQGITRVQAPMPRLQRHDSSLHKTASRKNWDEEMDAIKGHVASVLSKLGNA